MSAKQQYRKYQGLKRSYCARLKIPKKGTIEADMVTASLSSMDMTEAHLFYYALCEHVNDGPRATGSFLERMKANKELEEVNARSRHLWDWSKFTMRYFLSGVYKDVTAKP